MRVRPSGVEININGKRTGAPNGHSGKKRPAILDVLSGKEIRNEQSEETINRRPKRHSQDIWSGESIGGDMRAKSVGEKYKKVCSQQERSPQHSRSRSEEHTAELQPSPNL